MSTKRKVYTSAEKAKVAIEAIKEKMTLAEITSTYTVHPTQIKQWKRHVMDHLPELFSDKTQALKMDYESPLAGLYQQIGQLKVENDFLKKKSEKLGW